MADTLEHNIRFFLSLIGENVEREGLVNTPERVAKAWTELLNPEPFNLTTFDSNGYDEMIISQDIQYYTFCEHHLLPFFGKVSIGYIPSGKIVGLSKLARTVDYFSKRLNTQEYLTDNIANFLNDKLKPIGIGVVVTGRHLCQEMRGIKKRGNMLTSALKGAMLDDSTARKEFLELCRKQ
ncbi:MAG: GTP cyclohydrolase I [Candidatus Marinimicrobia bacterium]|nr:GTP cyclohydrolase I [Candidatus Neomarinimicrobiota bacterium]